MSTSRANFKFSQRINGPDETKYAMKEVATHDGLTAVASLDFSTMNGIVSTWNEEKGFGRLDVISNPIDRHIFITPCNHLSNDLGFVSNSIGENVFITEVLCSVI